MDKSYWDEAYGQGLTFNNPSGFASWALERLPPGTDLIADLGCGDGRDSVFFSDNGFHVVGIDQSESAIDRARSRVSGQRPNCRFVVADLAELREEVFQGRNTVFYLRFVLHALSDFEQEKLLRYVKSFRGLLGLFVEARTTWSDTNRLGLDLGRGIYFQDHHRRLVNYPTLLAEISETFSRVELLAGTGMSRLGEDDPHVVRIAALK